MICLLYDNMFNIIYPGFDSPAYLGSYLPAASGFGRRAGQSLNRSFSGPQHLPAWHGILVLPATALVRQPTGTGGAALQAAAGVTLCGGGMARAEPVNPPALAG